MAIRELKKNNSALSWFEKGFSSESNYLKINYFTHALDEAPDYKEALYHRGLAYHETNKFEKAISDFSQILQFNPEDFFACYSRGIALKMMEKFEDVI